MRSYQINLLFSCDMSGVRTPRPARVPVPHPHPLEVPQAWSLQPNSQRLRVRRQPIKRWTLKPSPGMIAI